MQIAGFLDDHAVAIKKQRRSRWPVLRRSEHLAPQADAVDEMILRIRLL